MATYQASRAIEDAIATGKALLKFISANDAGVTRTHQYGFYLPKGAWKLYALFGPVKGCQESEEVKVQWPDGLVTDSRVTWYGRATRSEYRLTRFGRDFPWRSADSVGNLLVLIPRSHKEFIAHVLDLEEDFDEIQNVLGLEITEGWVIYDRDQVGAAPEDPDDCIAARFRAFASKLTAFPSVLTFSRAVQHTLESCLNDFNTKSLDEQLLKLTEAEYRLFKMAERQIVQYDMCRQFKNVDDFLETASSIMNRRKSRAGRSLENHVQYLFHAAGLRFDAQAIIEKTKRPDLLFPSKMAYDDSSFPTGDLCLLGIKTTCKDRWRQVLNEGSRVPRKHILTLQPGISAKQLREMREAGVTLVVPKGLHKHYPPIKEHGMDILTIDRFVADIRAIQGGT